MFRYSVLDAEGRDMTQPSPRLSMGRPCYESLCTHHRVVIASDDRELASAIVRKPDGSPNSVCIGSFELVDNCPHEAVAALVYLALREARIVGCTLARFDAGKNVGTIAEILLKTKPLSGTATVVQCVDYGMHWAFAESGVAWQALLANTFPGEIERTVEHHLEDFFTKGAWATSVRNGELSRRQYVATLFNLHSYVRFTTRLLGHCIGDSDDRSLRAHYIEHLKGEIDHERIIERDLNNLGEDVEYVTASHQPVASIVHFMSIQESIIGYQRDPVLCLACPIAAESFAAYVQGDIVEGLKRSVASWGLSDPADVVHFIKSHSGFDGGADGHWNLCVKMVSSHMRTQQRMQKFSSVLHSAMTALRNNFDSCIADYVEPELNAT